MILPLAIPITGQLVGHIVKMVADIYAKAEQLKAQGITIEQSTVDMLCHIILAHHGQYEFGSPKLPAMAEAFMVNYIDDLDAKINQVTSAVDAETSDADWDGLAEFVADEVVSQNVLMGDVFAMAGCHAHACVGMLNPSMDYPFEPLYLSSQSSMLIQG